jgi:transcriptional regulator with XRE-family HTH domain
MQELFPARSIFSLGPDYDADMKRRAPSPVGARITALREAAGLTQRQLSEKIGVPQSNLAYWEHSAQAPPGAVLPKLSEALGISADELLGIKPPAPKRQAAKGRLQQVFEEVSKLPRRQQQKVIEMAEGFLSLHKSTSEKTT